MNEHLATLPERAILDSHKDLTISLRQYWPRSDAAGKLPVDKECEEFHPRTKQEQANKTKLTRTETNNENQ